MRPAPKWYRARGEGPSRRYADRTRRLDEELFALTFSALRERAFSPNGLGVVDWWMDFSGTHPGQDRTRSAGQGGSESSLFSCRLQELMLSLN